ncbi:MAG: hypothetical protein KI790_03265 [Cyclobacteriaceae bacterium]|nr:hypothetical protein [Cyclobacteriaceae bacterium HetDA_MAG_MS6]
MGSSKLNTAQRKLASQITSWKFKLFLLSKLPMGLLAGLKIESIDESSTVTSVPYNWLTKNPFQSMYFAVQSMAAELSTAASCLLAVQGQDVSVAYIIVDHEAKFLKKATSRVYFTCADSNIAFEAVEAAKATGDSQQATFMTVGKMGDGTVVSEYKFTWSFKVRNVL